jgi:hypothetical protein
VTGIVMAALLFLTWKEKHPQPAPAGADKKIPI